MSLSASVVCSELEELLDEDEKMDESEGNMSESAMSTAKTTMRALPAGPMLEVLFFLLCWAMRRRLSYCCSIRGVFAHKFIEYGTRSSDTPEFAESPTPPLDGRFPAHQIGTGRPARKKASLFNLSRDAAQETRRRPPR